MSLTQNLRKTESALSACVNHYGTGKGRGAEARESCYLQRKLSIQAIGLGRLQWNKIRQEKIN